MSGTSVTSDSADPEKLFDFCGQHKDERHRIFCNDCSVPVCTLCFLHAHKRHDGSEMTEIAEQRKRKIKNDMSKITELSTEIDVELDNLEECFEIFSKTVEEAEKKIVERGEEAKKIIDDQVRTVLHELQLEQKTRLTELELSKMKLEGQKTSLDIYRTYAEGVLKEMSPSHILNLTADLNVRDEQLKSMKINRIEHYPEITFLPCESQFLVLKDERLIGDVKTIYKSFPYSHAPTYENDPQLIATLQFNSEVRGIAVANQELFVVVDGSNEVHIYNAETSAFQTKFSVLGLSEPWSIAATDSALFISEFHSNCIRRIELPDRTVIKTWKVDGLYNKLSITKQGNILVSCIPAFQGDFQQLCEYTSDGILHKTIVIPTGMERLKYAFGIDGGGFLLTHSDSRLHRLCLIDGVGKVITSYGGAPGSGDGQLDGPSDVAVDQNGFIFVSCSDGNRVVLFNSLLEYVKDIIPAAADINLMSPIYLDELRGRLYVSDYQRKTITVFILN